ncbi:MAG: Smr protein [Proteobacteria bacterium]|nr:Smr protein [Pseudomonadota bacterium]
MNDEEKALFEQEMAGVRPLKHQEARILKKAGQSRPTPGQVYRREAAQRPLGNEENFLPAGFIEAVHPMEVLSFKRQGVQNGVFNSLQQGRYPVEATLDLHLLTIEQARKAVFEFIHDCMRLDIRTALINHGKGTRNPQTQAVIKSCVARWLPMFPEIMAFHSAQKFHGGVGAVYLLLRKSEKAKERTRESLGFKSAKPVP